MIKLKIKPVEYEGRRLQELGDRIVQVFYPLVNKFRLLPEIGLRTLLKKRELYNPEEFRYHTILFEPPFYVSINGKPFSEFLSGYGTPILGVSQMSMSKWTIFSEIPDALHRFSWYSSDSKCPEGYGSSEFKTAIVSTFNPKYGKLDTDRHLERLVRVAVHEIGHSLGLNHHRRKVETSNDKLCPMMPRGEIESADYMLCKYCYRALGIPEHKISV